MTNNPRGGGPAQFGTTGTTASGLPPVGVRASAPPEIDVDAELETLAPWSAYGTVWRKARPSPGVPVPDCTAENPCLKTGFVKFGTSEAAYEYVSYTVSDRSRVVVQGLDSAFHAQLIASAPELLRLVRSIASGDARLSEVVEDVKTLLAALAKPVRIPGRTDYTAGPWSADDFGGSDSWRDDDMDDE